MQKFKQLDSRRAFFEELHRRVSECEKGSDADGRALFFSVLDEKSGSANHAIHNASRKDILRNALLLASHADGAGAYAALGVLSIIAATFSARGMEDAATQATMDLLEPVLLATSHPASERSLADVEGVERLLELLMDIVRITPDGPGNGTLH